MRYPKNMEKYNLILKVAPRLGELRPGDILTYAEISSIMGRPWGDLYSREILSRARAMVAKTDIFFATVRGEGVRRLAGTEYEAQAASYTQRIHRAARKGYRIADAITQSEFDLLSPGSQVRHMVRQSSLEILISNSREAKIDKVARRSHNLPPDSMNRRAVLEAFSTLHQRIPKRRQS